MYPSAAYMHGAKLFVSINTYSFVVIMTISPCKFLKLCTGMQQLNMIKYSAQRGWIIVQSTYELACKVHQSDEFKSCEYCLQ